MKRLSAPLLILLLLPILVVALVLMVANTGAGRQIIESQSANFTGGKIILAGISGRFPDDLHIAHAELRDPKGAWFSADHLDVRWSPLALLTGTARVDLLSAKDITILRKPQPSAPAAAAASPRSFSLPVAIDLRALHVARLSLAPAVAQTEITLKIDGVAIIRSPRQGEFNFNLAQIGGLGAYQLSGHLAQSGVDVNLTASEQNGGMIAGLAKLPALGAINLTASIAGVINAEIITLDLTAGQLRARLNGSLDLIARSANLDITALAPAMAPSAAVSWGSIDARAHITGPFKSPNFTAHAAIQNLRSAGATIGSLTADATGTTASIDGRAAITGLRIPGANPDLFASAPFDFTLHADPAAPNLPLNFTLKSKLITADGTATLGSAIAATINTSLPDLAPVAAIAHIDTKGHTEATLTLSSQSGAAAITLAGTADFTGGAVPPAALFAKTTYAVTANLTGPDLKITRAVIDGNKLHASLSGATTQGKLDFTWQLALPDLTALAQKLKGGLHATGKLQGLPQHLTLTADLKADAGINDIPKAPISISLAAQNFPSAPNAALTASGSFGGAPITLDATFDQSAAGVAHALIKRAAWKSFALDADLWFAKGAALPQGTLSARMASLADLAPVTHQKIAGAFIAKISSTANQDTKIDISATNLGAATSKIARLTLGGTVRDPATTPNLSLALTADGIAAPNLTASARANLQGTLNALTLRLTSSAQASGTPATLTAQASADFTAHQLTLQNFVVDYKKEFLRLTAPARIAYGATTAIDRLRMALGAATLEIAGKITPSLDLTASLRNVTPELAKPFDHGLKATGLLTADANLTGTLAAPRGTLRLQASNVRASTGPAASLPATNVFATAALNGDSAQISAHAQAGTKLHFSLTGTAPINQTAALAIRTTGAIDLKLLDPLLNASGQRAAGLVTLDANFTGSIAAPRISGALTLTNGELQDFVQGIHISAINANLAALGEQVKIENFTAKAGPGTIALTGTIGVSAPGFPVDLHLTAKNARPLASDLMTADLNADLAVQGNATGNLRASGNLFLQKVEINIPDSLPPNVAVLTVRAPGYKPPPPAPAAPPSATSLDITVDAPSNIFVRGHGLESELSGKLTLTGTTATPQIDGGFTLRRGDIDLAGTTLTFSKGEVSFDGSSVTAKIDPTLNFTADTVSAGVTATLTVSGYADAPKIALSSIPDLPQDEVLAHLLFGASIKDLSTLQIAEIGVALAQWTGATGGIDPLAAVRKQLGLDRLSVGTSSSTGASVEAGRYVARGVYVGARQNTSGGTAAIVQIDLAKRLKLTSQLATGGGTVQGATPDNDPGSTIGLSYGFDY